MSFALISQKSPGVHVSEVRSGSAPIVGVGTSTAAALLRQDPLLTAQLKVLRADVPDLTGEWADRDIVYASKLAANQPVTVHNFTEFKAAADGAYRERLGAALRSLPPAQQVPENPTHAALTAAVATFDAALGSAFAAIYGFFLNGGTRLHVVVYDDIVAALTALELLDDVSIVFAPGLVAGDAASKAALESLRAHVTTQTRGRMVILDGPAGADVHDFGQAPPVPAQSPHIAYYYPRIDAVDPFGGTTRIGPSGHVAGAWARVDATRGVHKAPANVELLGATDVEVVVSRDDQAGMNTAGVNAIRRFDGTLRIYGARTLGGDRNGEQKFINVQRTLDYLVRSIEQGMQWVVFEPNTPALWGRITRNIHAFLHEVWATGALFGSSPEQAWYVRCDAALNPPETRETGHLKVEVGVALARPAEFIVVHLTQWSGPGK